MPLIVSKLASQLANVFQQMGDSSADKIAQAYFDYVRLAIGPTGSPLLLRGTERQAMATAFRLLSSGQYPLIASAQAIGVGVTNFWLMPPVLTSSGGVCTTVLTGPGVAMLIASKADTVIDGANNMANALHAMTKTVFMIEQPPLVSGMIL